MTEPIKLASKQLAKKLRGYLFDRYSAPSFGSHGAQSWYGINREDIEAIIAILETHHDQ